MLPTAILLAAFVFALSQRVSGSPAVGKESYKESLIFSCLDSPFLSVSASTPDHRDFPRVELQLTDTLGRSTGYGQHSHPIPDSSYRRVVELPDLPERSKALAVEVCNATVGNYDLTVSEESTGPYRLSVRGVAPGLDGETRILHPVPQEGRICRYRFTFSLTERGANIHWLDEAGNVIESHTRDAPCIPVKTT
jgi:hypothetical protein